MAKLIDQIIARCDAYKPTTLHANARRIDARLDAIVAMCDADEKMPDGTRVRVKAHMQGGGKKGTTSQTGSRGFVQVNFDRGGSAIYHASDLDEVGRRTRKSDSRLDAIVSMCDTFGKDAPRADAEAPQSSMHTKKSEARTRANELRAAGHMVKIFKHTGAYTVPGRGMTPYENYEVRPLGAARSDAGAFAKLERKLAHDPKVRDPAAVAAKIGRETIGEKEMARRSAAARRHDELQGRRFRSDAERLDALLTACDSWEESKQIKDK